MMNSLTLDQFIVFVTAVDQGGFTAAARHLNRTQSAVTYALKRLEQESGVTLFDRSAYRPTLTAAGHSLLVRARKVVDSVGSYRLQAQTMASGVEAELVLAVDPLFPFSLLSNALEKFPRSFPSVQLRIIGRTADQIILDVMEYRANIGILVSGSSAPQELSQNELFRFALVSVVSPEHPLAKIDGSIELEQMQGYLQIVLQSGQPLPNDFDLGSSAVNIWYVSDYQIKQQLLCAGIGWGTLPLPVAEADLAAGRLKPLELCDTGLALPVPTSGATVIFRKDRAAGPSGSWLLSTLAASVEARTI